MIAILIEDDPHKGHQITDYLHADFPALTVAEYRSYQSGMRAIATQRPALVLLDMAIPSFDVSEDESGGRMRTTGGRDVLSEVYRLGLPCSVIIITQFETFGEGDELQTLDQMSSDLQIHFPSHYKGTVYYHASRSDWRAKLKALLVPLTRQLSREAPR